MPSKRSFIDSRPKLFIALKQIDMDTFYRHLFIIAERRYPVTLYEQLVIELTNRSFSLQAAYRSGGTPYELSDRESEPYDQQIKDFAHMIEEADCVLVGGASGLSAAGGGDFYYEDNATYRRHFGKFAERYGFKGAFEGSFYRWPTAEARWGYLTTFLDTTLNAPLRKPYKDRYSRREGFLRAHHQPRHAVCEALSLGEGGRDPRRPPLLSVLPLLH